MKSSLTQEQQSDVALLMSLDTPELIQEWMEAVGKDDVAYGISLLHVAAYEASDDNIDTQAQSIGDNVIANLMKASRY